MSNASAILRGMGRAVTAADKRATLERIYAIWLKFPDQRLGQLLVNAATARSKAPLFYAEDDTLCDALEAMAGIRKRKEWERKK